MSAADRGQSGSGRNRFSARFKTVAQQVPRRQGLGRSVPCIRAARREGDATSRPVRTAERGQLEGGKGVIYPSLARHRFGEEQGYRKNETASAPDPSDCFPEPWGSSRCCRPSARPRKRLGRAVFRCCVVPKAGSGTVITSSVIRRVVPKGRSSSAGCEVRQIEAQRPPCDLDHEGIRREPFVG